MRARVEKLALEPGQRVLAVSDVHADWYALERALEQAGFGAEDRLVILGDVLEKGTENIDTLRYVMALAQRPNVHVVMGNCDSVTLEFLEYPEGYGAGYMDWYQNHWRGRSFVTEAAARAGLPLRGPEDYPPVQALLREEYGPELDFLRGLPTILESDQVIFVHGGVASEVGMDRLDAWHCMKNDNFLSQDTHLSKWCVVGHWPSSAYRQDISDLAPIVLGDKKIVSIDGGRSLKPDGQLNVLMFRAGENEFSWTAWDGLERVTALEGQGVSAESVNISFANGAVEVLERGETVARCRHKSSGRVTDIPNRLLYRRGGELVSEDYTDYRLPVEPGDVLAVVERTEKGLLAKKGSVTGWYFGRYTPN